MANIFREGKPGNVRLLFEPIDASQWADSEWHTVQWGHDTEIPRMAYSEADSAIRQWAAKNGHKATVKTTRQDKYDQKITFKLTRQEEAPST